MTLTNLAKQAEGANITAIGKLRSIEGYLKRHYYSYQPSGLAGSSLPSIESGSSLASIEGFLLGTKTGQDEQFAASFALLARVLGMPARVVVGYSLGRQDQVGSGAYEVTTADAYAWPEVDFAGYGWVAFDPLDPKKAKPSELPPPSRGTVYKTPPALTPAPAVPQPQPAPVPTLRASGSSGAAFWNDPLLLWLLAGGMLMLVPALAAAGILSAKALRRRRRARAGSPAERIFGAWNEICDHLLTCGVALDVSNTPAETILRATPHIGAAATSSLSAIEAIVNAATYSLVDPDGRAADRTWLLEAQAREAVRRDSGLAARWRSALDPRPLRPRRHPAGRLSVTR